MWTSFLLSVFIVTRMVANFVAASMFSERWTTLEDGCVKISANQGFCYGHWITGVCIGTFLSPVTVMLDAEGIPEAFLLQSEEP